MIKTARRRRVGIHQLTIVEDLCRCVQDIKHCVVSFSTIWSEAPLWARLSGCQSVGRSFGRFGSLVIISSKGSKFYFHAPIGELVFANLLYALLPLFLPSILLSPHIGSETSLWTRLSVGFTSMLVTDHLFLICWSDLYYLCSPSSLLSQDIFIVPFHMLS